MAPLATRALTWRTPATSRSTKSPASSRWACHPLQAPDKPTYITLDFEKGVPVALDGKKMSAKDIILALNEVGGENGIGLLDIVENRLVGMKCRGVYETPGGAILYFAHNVSRDALPRQNDHAHRSRSCLSPLQTLSTTGSGTHRFARRSPLSSTKTQEHVTGKVRIKLYKGNMIKAGAWSDWSLYSEEIATFGEDRRLQPGRQRADFISSVRSADQGAGTRLTAKNAKKKYEQRQSIGRPARYE